MNAKVTTYWTEHPPMTREMPESFVQDYLNNLRNAGINGGMKGYIVDAVPLEEIQPRAPIPFEAGDMIVTQSGRLAAFIGTDPSYPDSYVVRIAGFGSDYILVKREGVRRA
jgi:hypothetical protein